MVRALSVSAFRPTLAIAVLICGQLTSSSVFSQSVAADLNEPSSDAVWVDDQPQHSNSFDERNSFGSAAPEYDVLALLPKFAHSTVPGLSHSNKLLGIAVDELRELQIRIAIRLRTLRPIGVDAGFDGSKLSRKTVVDVEHLKTRRAEGVFEGTRHVVTRMFVYHVPDRLLAQGEMGVRNFEIDHRIGMPSEIAPHQP